MSREVIEGERLVFPRGDDVFTIHKTRASDRTGCGEPIDQLLREWGRSARNGRVLDARQYAEWRTLVGDDYQIIHCGKRGCWG